MEKMEKSLLVMLVILACSVHSRKASISTALRVRGGVERSHFEMTTEYNPHPGYRQQQMLSQPMTLGDLDNRPQHYEVNSQSWLTPTTNLGNRSQRSTTKQNPLERIRCFAIELHRNSPALSLTTFTCLLVYVAWQFPFFHGLLQSHFVCSGFNVQKGRVACILLSAVSHASPMHLFINLTSFLILGPSLQQTLKTNNWSLYPLIFGSALAGSLAFLMWGGGGGGCMGLSGVTLAMMALQTKLFPDKEFRMVLAVFPVTLKADMALTCLLIWSVVGSLARNSEVAHITHLGGLLFGMGYYEVWLRRNQVKWQFHKGNAKLKKMIHSCKWYKP